MLKAQDLVISCYLACYGGTGAWTYARLGQCLGLSTSRVHEAVARAQRCHLLSESVDGPWAARKHALLELCRYGVRYVFSAQPGGDSRGIPTAQASPWFQEAFAPVDRSGPVWPDPQGPARGPSLDPLHTAVIAGIKQDPRKEFYQVMVLLDLLRIGQARERTFAQDRLVKIWGGG